MADGSPKTYVPDLPNLAVLERRYEFIRELGRGGMAAVHLVRHRERNELVALKAICRRYAEDEESLARFEREARMLAAIAHPNIVRTLGIESVEDRTVAIVMEYMHGCTLRALLREQPRLATDAAAAILRDVARALAYAHELGVVHRDVKPDNIFLDEDAGCARLADFGIARALSSDAEITLAGMALGTPAYMSPEQIDGVPLDGRSDIYSLGVVGWEMLAGARPWDGESLYGMIYRQKHDHLTDLALLRGDIPAPLLHAIDGALRKDAHERWSATEFLDALEGALHAPRRSTLPGRATAPNDFATLRFRRLERDSRSSTVGDVDYEPSPEHAPAAFSTAVPDADPALQPGSIPPVAGYDDPTPPPTARVEEVPWDDPPAWPLAPWSDIAESGAQSVTEPAGVATPPWEMSHPHDVIEPAPAIPRRPLALAAFVLVATLGAGAISERRTPEDPRALLASASTGSLGGFGVAGMSGGLTSHTGRASAAAARARRDSLTSCNRPALEHQRLCAQMLAASANADVALAFDELVRRLAVTGAVRAGSSPDTLRRLRVVQRAWQIERDLECAERIPERDGERWALLRSECIAAITADRAQELRAEARGSPAAER